MNGQIEHGPEPVVQQGDLELVRERQAWWGSAVSFHKSLIELFFLFFFFLCFFWSLGGDYFFEPRATGPGRVLVPGSGAFKTFTRSSGHLLPRLLLLPNGPSPPLINSFLHLMHTYTYNLYFCKSYPFCLFSIKNKLS